MGRGARGVWKGYVLCVHSATPLSGRECWQQHQIFAMVAKLGVSPELGGSSRAIREDAVTGPLRGCHSHQATAPPAPQCDAVRMRQI